MKRIAAFPSLRLCTALLLCLGAVSYGLDASSQLGIVERPTLPGSMRPGKTEGEVKNITVPKGYKVIMVAPEDSVVRLMEAPEMPEGQYGVNVWIEATFVQMERRISRQFEKTIGFKLSPPDGKALLNAEEKEKIIAAIEQMEDARIIASLVILTVPGQQAQSEHVEEMTYPTEWEYKDGKGIPGNWEKRDVGAIFNVTPVVSKDGVITLVMMPEVTTFAGWQKYDGSDVTQPIFKTWNTTTVIHVPDGLTFVLKESPVTPPFCSQVIDPEEASNPEKQVTLLTLVSAKVIEVTGQQ